MNTTDLLRLVQGYGALRDAAARPVVGDADRHYHDMSERLAGETYDEIAAAIPGVGKVLVLDADQLCALHELLGLVHYDDLTRSWLDMLPTEMHPQRGRTAGTVETKES